MNKNIKYIRLGLENVEVIDLDIKDVVYLKHDKSTNNTIIKISKNASKKTYSCYNQKPRNIFRRLTKYNDICDISYLDKNKKIIEEIVMPWDERHEDFNSLQSYKYESGNLVISISSNENHCLELDINKNDFEKK